MIKIIIALLVIASILTGGYYIYQNYPMVFRALIAGICASIGMWLTDIE